MNAFSAAQKELAKIAQTDLQEMSLAQIDILTLQVEGYIDRGKHCIYMAEQELQQIKKALAVLGETVTGEPREISKERGSLQDQKNQADVRRAQCRLLILRASEINKKLNENKRQVFTRDLFFRSPGIFKLLRQNVNNSWSWPQEIAFFFTSGSGIGSLTPVHFSLIVLFLGLGLFLGNRIDLLVLRHFKQSQHEGFFFDFWRVLSRHKKTFQVIGALSGISLSLLFVTKDLQPSPYLPSAVNSALLILILSNFGKIYAQVLALTVQQPPPPPVIKNFSETFQFHMFAVLSGFLWFVYTSPLITALSEATFFLLRALTITLWYVSLLWIFWNFCRYSRFQTWRRSIRVFLVFMFGSAILAELTGFRILASHLLAGTCGTIVFSFILSFFLFLTNEILGGFGRGKYLWQQNIREKAGIETSHVLKGLIWTSSLFKLSLTIVFLYFILRLWGVSEVYASTFYDGLVEGFALGSITVVPAQIGVGLLIVVFGWSSVSFVKDKIIRKWLSESELVPSVQDALSTVIGYIGYSLIIFVGLSTAGISFSGLAIVAGALSVGIGFGLQNIVNNLVSGLILLFERPIKRGDWIVVGSTEGYVKKISVRSTIIQTFDQSDVIVPNSELISSQVTNMMFQDTRGRMRLSVGVAYGSDTQLVKQLLLMVAKAHPEVISNGTVPHPVVRFQAFGESSLDFELLCHLKDVDKRIDVRSDMHFAIDYAFRENGIEIPFPQRDVHIRSSVLEKKEETCFEQQEPGS